MFRKLTSSAMALAAIGTPAFADVTPEQVWQSWVEYYQSMGYTVTEGGRDMSGDTLTVRDILIAGGPETGRVEVKLPQALLTGQGDGKVKTVFSDNMDLTLEGAEPEGGTYTIPVKVSLPGNGMVTSGAPEDMTHAFNYPTIELALTTMTSDGDERPLPMNFALQNSTGNFHVVSGNPAKYDYDLKTEKVTFSGDVSDEEEGSVKFAGSMEGIEGDGSMTAPEGIANLEEQMSEALKAGLAMDGRMKAGAVNATFEFSGTDESGQPSSGAGKYDGKGFDGSFTLSSAGMGYQLGSDAMQFDMTSPQLPFPINYAVNSGSFNMQLPVTQQDAPQPFKFAYSLQGVSLGDAIWNMFDPEAKLPRDPASLEIDLGGLMKVTKDLFALPEPDTGDETPPADATDDATAESMSPDAPADDAEAQAQMDEMDDETSAEPSGFEPVQLDINQIALNLLGASATATGSLKTPESGSMDAPVGQVHAEFQGINGLLDKLGGIGLIPQDQMMGVRMMLAMFAKPVEGSDDKLTTELEFKDGGAIFANGQQIK